MQCEHTLWCKLVDFLLWIRDVFWPQHPTCWDPISKHISNPDLAGAMLDEWYTASSSGVQLPFASKAVYAYTLFIAALPHAGVPERKGEQTCQQAENPGTGCP